jgi:hypothetical protein
MFELPGNYDQFLEIERDMNDVALGEEVVIYGNSLGGGIRLSEAKIIQKSQNEIEVSGGIVPGNSGGPIIRKKNGKLLAVSTYATVRSGSPQTISDYIKAAALPEVRFYGVRIDTLQQPIQFDLRKFLAETNIIEEDKKRLQRGLVFLVLLAMKLGVNSTPEMQAIAARSDFSQQNVLAHLKPSGLYPGTYDIQTVATLTAAGSSFFVLTGNPTSYIHKK